MTFFINEAVYILLEVVNISLFNVIASNYPKIKLISIFQT